MTKTKAFLTFATIIITSCIVFSQSSLVRNIAVQARVLEQLKGSIRSVPFAKLNMIGLGEYATDESGRFAFKAPLEDFNRRDARLVIEIRVEDYEIIRPYKGMVQLDTEKAQINMEVLVIGRDLEEEYREKLSSLSKKLRRTERNNALSLNRMNAMNDSLINSMQRDAERRIALEKSISDLRAKAESEESQKKEFADDLARAEKQLEQLRQSLQTREDELYVALEERYLRQQNYQKAISADLKDYLIHVKDVHDLLQNIDRYFKPGKYPNYTTSYNSTLTAYNEIFEKINENYLDYVQGVKRYWDAPILARQVEDTFDILFDQLHHPNLFPAISEVNGYIMKNKSGKATKIAHKAFHDLNPLILNLEKSVNRTLEML